MMLRWASVIVLLVAACGPGPIPADEFQSAYVGAWCARAARCGVVADAALCEAGNLYDHSQARESVAAGRAAYDGEAARACVDAIAVDDCSFVRVPACAQVVTGLRQPGEACLVTLDCASGTCARPDTCTEACCAGTCVASGSTGASCTSGAGCDDGLVCTPTAASTGSTCQPRPALGETCAYDGQCEGGLYCAITYQPDDSVAGTCAVPAARGEACDATSPDTSCRSVEDYCGTTSTCVPRIEAGGVCDHIGGGLSAFSDNCRLHATCDDETRVCRPFGAGTGTSCRELPCEPGYQCNASSLCVPVPVRAVCE